MHNIAATPSQTIPEIYIFDDSISAFIIAHRLSTIRDADPILHMEHGSIIEQGNHETFIAAKGAYWRLYNAQFQAPGVDFND